MFASRHPWAITASLLFAIFLWGGNNAGIKYLVKFWPPIWVGGTRFLCAGALMFGLMRWTSWLGPVSPITGPLRRELWWRAGLVLAVYIVVFNWALRFTDASHVVLYLGASPVWALLWEGRAGQSRRTLVARGLAALLALLGVLTLVWPTLRAATGRLPGELLGLAASVLWTLFGRQTRHLGAYLSGAQITAHAMWWAGLLLVPLGIVEACYYGLTWSPAILGTQAYCIIAGGIMAFALWNNALRHWKTSEVFLFNNLIPLSTMLWAHFTLGELVTPTFWLAMALIFAGVIAGQVSSRKGWGQRQE